MSKNEVIAEMAGESGLTHKVCKQALEAFMKVVADALTDGSEVNLIGFGKFSVGERAERDSINPKTREIMHLPARPYPKFRFGKPIRDAVAGNIE